MKEKMSSFDIMALIFELNHIIADSRIKNIYQLRNKIQLLKLRTNNGKFINFLIEPSKRIHTTSYSYKIPSKPSSFSMALRKYLRNGVIFGIIKRAQLA